MAITSKTKYESDGSKLDYSPQERIKVEAPATVQIQCMIDSKVKLTGTATGNVYIFSGAGSVVEVALEDKDEILNKKRGRSCCGKGNSQLFTLFEV